MVPERLGLTVWWIILGDSDMSATIAEARPMPTGEVGVGGVWKVASGLPALLLLLLLLKWLLFVGGELVRPTVLASRRRRLPKEAAGTETLMLGFLLWAWGGGLVFPLLLSAIFSFSLFFGPSLPA
jgi:hypothetical protein